MKVFAMLSCLLMLAGCNRSVGDVYQPGVPSAVGLVAGQGDMPVVISGRFYEMPQTEFDSLITDMMYGRNAGPLVRFTTSPKPGSTENYSVRMLFGAPDNFGHSMMCNPESVPSPEPLSSKMIVTAAFCYKDRMESGATGIFYPEDGTDRAGLKRLIHGMMTTMFPLFDPFSDGGCGGSIIDC
ncbi:MAG: hypothetical protein RIC36_18015 [Rhodospirillales bacterium]